MTLPRTRATLIGLAVCFAIAAIGYWGGRDAEAYLPLLWPAWFAASAVACTVFAWQIHSSRWWQASRVLVVIGVLSRCVGVVGRILSGQVTSTWSAVAGIAIYAAAAVAFYRLWAVDLRFISRHVAATNGH